MNRTLKIWCKLDKNKEDMNLWIFLIFNETFLEQSIWICKWVDVVASKILFFFFLLKHVKVSPHIKICRSKHSAFIQSGYKASFTFSFRKYGIFVISVNKIHGKVRQWHQLIHLHIHIDCSRNVSLKIMEIQNFMAGILEG